MRALMRELKHPERAFKSILIAGTNGKGSVSAYLDEGLRAASLRVGRYTSPHLIDIRERVTVSGRNIGPAAFERLVLEVRDASERLVEKRILPAHPNHFEILTAVAFLFFRENKVDIAVLEVGLGGRLDATNVASPLVSTIVSIDFDHEEGPRSVTLDKQMLSNVITNLVTNAVKYSPEGKRVTLRTAVRDGRLSITVSDEGMGIPKEDQQHLFERFFRGGNATNIQGTGLGLNIAKEIIDWHGGEIEVRAGDVYPTDFFMELRYDGDHYCFPFDQPRP